MKTCTNIFLDISLFSELSSKCSVPNLLFPLTSIIFPLFKTCHRPSSLTECICTAWYEVVNFYFAVVSNSLAYITFPLKQGKTKNNWNEKFNCIITSAKSRQSEKSWQSSTIEGSRPKVEWVTISINIKGLRNDYHSFIVIFEDQCKVMLPEFGQMALHNSIIILIYHICHLIDQVLYSQHYFQSDQNAVFTFYSLIILLAVC